MSKGSPVAALAEQTFDTLALLIRDGIVTQETRIASGRGRPGTRFTLRPQARQSYGTNGETEQPPAEPP